MTGLTGLARRLGVAALTLLAASGPAVADCGHASGPDEALIATPRAAAAIAEADATLPNAEGRLWRVATEPPSYLIGTFHIAAGGIDRPGPVLADIVAEAEELFVEVDTPALQDALAQWTADPARLFRPAGDRFADGLNAQEKARAEEVLAMYGVPFAVADQMRPFVLIGLLSLPPCAIDLAGAPGLDAALETVAHEAGVPVDALETVDEQLAALEGDPDGLDEILRLMLSQASSYEEDWFLYLALYRTRHIGAIWSLGLQSMRLLAGADQTAAIANAFWDRLVDTRNRRMVERMLPALREGGRVVAVGALHLPGEAGLVALLRAEGLTVERVADDPALPERAAAPTEGDEAAPAPDEPDPAAKDDAPL